MKVFRSIRADSSNILFFSQLKVYLYRYSENKCCNYDISYFSCFNRFWRHNFIFLKTAVCSRTVNLVFFVRTVFRTCIFNWLGSFQRFRCSISLVYLYIDYTSTQIECSFAPKYYYYISCSYYNTVCHFKFNSYSLISVLILLVMAK